eukprot:SM000044S15939  [mRNA]  locus=s44:182513:185198:+ [translate_table: standard]
MHASPPELVGPAPPLPPSSCIAAANDAPPAVQLSLCRHLLICILYIHAHSYSYGVSCGVLLPRPAGRLNTAADSHGSATTCSKQRTAAANEQARLYVNRLTRRHMQRTSPSTDCPDISFLAAPSLRGAINACRGPSPNSTRCCRPLGVVQEELSILYPATYGQATVNIAVNAACNAALQAALQVRGVTVNVLALCPEELGVQCISPVRNTCPAKSVFESGHCLQEGSRRAEELLAFAGRVLRPLVVACGSRAVNATIACSICLLELATGVNSLMHSSGSTHHVNQTVANDCAALLIVSALVVEPLTARSFAYIQRWNCRAVVPTDDEKTFAISIP